MERNYITKNKLIAEDDVKKLRDYAIFVAKKSAKNMLKGKNIIMSKQ